MNIDQAREYLVRNYKFEYKNYILNRLAGDFAVEIAEEHERLTTQLDAELSLVSFTTND